MYDNGFTIVPAPVSSDGMPASNVTCEDAQIVGLRRGRAVLQRLRAQCQFGDSDRVPDESRSSRKHANTNFASLYAPDNRIAVVLIEVSHGQEGVGATAVVH